MRAVIVHFFSVCGGGERVALEMASALSDMGFEVLFATNSAKAMRECSVLMDKPVYKAIETGVFIEKAPLIGDRFIRSRRLLLCEKAIKRAREIADIIIDTAFNAPSSADITYIHFPAFTRRKGLIRSTYDRLLYRKVVDLMREHGVVLANSKWTALYVERVYGVKPHVLYPPVDVEYFKYSGGEKKKLIATVTRLSPEKHIHLLLNIKIPGYKWVIIGSTSQSTRGHSSLTYYDRLINAARKTGIHLVLRNQPRNTLRHYLQSALFYVHPPLPEHFGISVVEAMAAGAIPIVYRDGGAWYDVVSRLDSRLGYRDVYEIPEIVKSMEDEAVELSKKAMEMAGEYGVEVFRRRLVDIVDEYLNKTTI